MLTPNNYVTHNSSLLFANWPTQPGKAQPAEQHMPIEAIMRLSGITTDPVYSFQANGRIHDLEDLYHDSTEILYLQDKTVQIYLFEPMCCYLIDDPDRLYESMPFNSGFYSEFNPGTEQHHRCVELDSIQLYAQHNNIRVTVRTGDYNVEQYSAQYPELTLICDDAFLKTLMVYQDATEIDKHIDTRFISTNWRYTVARAAVSAYLTDYDCNLVWCYDVDPGVVLDQSVWLRNATQAMREKITQGTTLLNQQGPRCLDIPVTASTTVVENNCSYYPEHAQLQQHNPVGLNNIQSSLKSFYEQSFVDVVTESRYAQPTSNLSEKVFQSIQYQTPFLLVAPPGSLQYLHDMGFKTFSNWWDESYDTETNHVKRLDKVFAIIQQIADMSMSDINTMYTEMLPQLKTNLDLYTTAYTIPGEPVVRDNQEQDALVKWT